MGPGKAFGELAILYNCTRTATVKGNVDGGWSIWIKLSKYKIIRLTTRLCRNEADWRMVRQGEISEYTRKNAQVVTNLQQTCSNAVPKTCQQDVFVFLLIPNMLTSCQRLVVNGLLATCYKVVELNRLVTVLQFINLLTSCWVTTL
jgi:hypothetical protein